MEFLSIEHVIELHGLIIDQSGGTHGILSLAGLESALAQPHLTFDGNDLYSALADKVGAEAHSLIANHPFLDGNKRIGHAVLETTLVLNGCELSPDRDEQERVILRVAAGDMDRQTFIEWVKRSIVPLPS
ncbi:MAG: type II toxin-antitoxin system death-on-curing family toxin [Candidatus Hydrogenedentes bacterium]|nr:type II toxin-antitoxin system death-on-curing family toxin [Candidatus Hydrogenedentota bacterium]